MNVPNLLSLSRILAVPVFLVLMIEPTPDRALWSGILFAVASITDWIDGYLARNWGQVTKVGKLLDPLADKILIIAALILLMNIDPDNVPAWAIIIIVAREIAVTGLRAKAAGEGIIIAAENMGKYKVGAQITVVLCFVWNYTIGQDWVVILGTVALWLSVTLAVISGVQYFTAYWRRLS